MNAIDLANIDLNDDSDIGVGEDTKPQAEVAVTATESPVVAVEEVPTPVTVVTQITDAVTVVRSGAGRKVDTTGKTALGAARLLFAANPTLGTKELKNLFLKELSPKFGTTPQVAQTYVSYVRKPQKKAAKKAA